ncbi:MAG: MBL fold metallo-hydrolase [Micrococcales bacterium 70-64]|nr:MBL fold metallo-hydrolase [Leifsonia sp.]ODU64527.1 MAG: MBL fold metallo-hydrolase [Leifsonia sp. SCN 70-46]OJX86219.1 MAG: MBL fold metallo-hydrolase [Micrococcales bacterium 70-64]
MKLTKFEHSCLVVEKAGSRLVIDPGSFTLPLADLDGVVAIVITHEHADHWTPEHLERILDRNPDARILGPAGVAAAAKDFTVETVAGGDTVEVEPFSLRFFGEKHAVIHSSIPVVDNVGVMVDEKLYYGGDSYTVPDVPVEVLAAPIGAPWLKIGEAMDYVLEVKPRRSFPIHEAVLSQIGKTMTQARIEAVTQQGGGEFFVLEPGESLEL